MENASLTGQGLDLCSWQAKKFQFREIFGKIAYADYRAKARRLRRQGEKDKGRKFKRLGGYKGCGAALIDHQ